MHHVKIVHNPNYWPIWGSDLISAVNECQQQGATVINMSIAGTEPSDAEKQAMDNAYANGALLVAAAGNRGSSAIFYPAGYQSVIAVGAIDKDQQAWRYTQQNDTIELVAPGVGVKSTIPNNQYRAWDGTSMATPHVTGVAALVWSQFPSCSNMRIRQALHESAIDLGQQGKDTTYGHGLIQAKAAVDWLNTHGCDGLRSCKAILDAGLSIGDGLYTIDFDGPAGEEPAMEVTCDMTTDGGGWTGITPEVAYELNGHRLINRKSAPQRYGFSSKRPYTVSRDRHYLIWYDIPFHFEASAFFLKDYYFRGTGNNNFDLGPNNPMQHWNYSLNNYWGDLAIGSGEEEAPKYRQSSKGSQQIVPNRNYLIELPAPIAFDAPVTSLRIAWSQSGAYEGLYPFYNGYIFVR